MFRKLIVEGADGDTLAIATVTCTSVATRVIAATTIVDAAVSWTIRACSESELANSLWVVDEGGIDRLAWAISELVKSKLTKVSKI